MVANNLRVSALGGIVALALVTAAAQAALVDTRIDTTTTGATVDGVLGADEYGPGNSYSYTGGGGGFGGTLGGGTLYMNSDAANLYIGFQLGNNLNDNVVIHMSTGPGGFTDSDMNDTADPGRNLLSNLTRDVDDVFPILPNHGVVIGGFGIVVFELNAGSTPGHLTFLQFSGTFTGNDPALFREIAIPLASIGSPTAIDFFVTYGSDTNFMSNESIPFQPYNSAGNPGFDNGGVPLVHENYNRFVVVPEPTSLGLVGLAGVMLLGRRRN